MKIKGAARVFSALLLLGTCCQPAWSFTFGGEVALKGTVRRLSESDLIEREFRQPNSRKAADFIAQCFKSIGLSPVKGAFIHPFPGGRNVMGLLKGSGKGVIIVQAHYDTEGAKNAGASDNAAGVASLLEMASTLKGGGKLTKSVLFACFDGEEYGYAGARAFLSSPPIPLGSIETYLSFDSIGRTFGDSHSWRFFCAGSEFCTGQRLALSNRPWFVQLVGTDLLGDRGSYSLFKNQGIPFLYFTNGRTLDSHGPADTEEKLNYEMMNEQVDCLTKLISTLGATPRHLKTSFAKEPKDVSLIKAMWEEFKPKLKHLPSPYLQGVPAIESRLQDKHPERSDLVQAFGMMETAIAPWVTTEALAVIDARRGEAANDKRGALKAYRKALKASRTKMAREWYQKRIEELSK